MIPLWVCAALLAALIPASSVGAQPEAPPEPLPESDARLVELLNDYRVSQGLHPLIAHGGLSARASEWSTHMASAAVDCYDKAGPNWGHSSLTPRDDDPSGTISRGENISWQCTSGNFPAMTEPPESPDYCEDAVILSPESVFCDWLNSPGHHANIVNAKWTHIGSGSVVVNVDFWTQVYSTHVFSESSTELTLDPNCDGVLNILDAFAVAQYVVGQRTGAQSCPLGNPSTEINVAKSDFNGDGVLNILDAFYASGCVVGTEQCD